MARQKKKWNKENIQLLISTNDAALARGLLVIYGFQTAAEQASNVTNEDNGMGFNGTDAEYLSSVAQFVEKTGYLTVKQIPHVRKAMLKYWRQLAEVANQKEAAKVAANA